MKKALIAGAASTVLAAMPVVGVFATSAATPTTFNDDLNVKVPGACTLENSTSGVYTDDNRVFDQVTIQPGTIGYINASDDDTALTSNGTYTIHCTAGTGTWAVTVSATTNALLGTVSGTSIAPGTTFSGTTSAWAIKSNAVDTDPSTITASTGDPYADYAAYSAGNFLTGSAKAGSGVTFNPSYKIFVSADQAADTYTGTVTYTIAYTAPVVEP